MDWWRNQCCLWNQCLSMPYVSGCVSTSEVTNKFEIIMFTNLLSFKILCHISKISDSHKSIPHSLIDYYQECGHAGRDGEPATCILFYNYADHYTQWGIETSVCFKHLFIFKLLFIYNFFLDEPNCNHVVRKCFLFYLCISISWLTT